MAAASREQVLRFFFRPEGRISRIEYGLGFLFILATDLAGLAFVFTNAANAPALWLPTGLVGLPLTIGYFVIAAKRGHDFGLPGSFVVLLLLPIFGILWVFFLALAPGDPRPNQYGPPPRFGPD
jgi:uncharacterized membrane protein YhaH (DUF805 family)